MAHKMLAKKIQQFSDALAPSHQHIKKHGKIMVHTIMGPFAQSAEALSIRFLEPIILESLPGYRSGHIAGKCLIAADYVGLFWEDDLLVGFATMRRFELSRIAVAYLTLAAFRSAYQRQGLLRGWLEQHFDEFSADILAGTSNVPALWCLFSDLSKRMRANSLSFVLPHAKHTPSPRTVSFSRELLSVALVRPLETISIGDDLVRRGYRSTDLQSLTTPEYFQQQKQIALCERRPSLCEAVDLFQNLLSLNVGDAVLLLADLCGILESMNKGELK